MLQYRLTQETNADFEAEGQSLILHIIHNDIIYEHRLDPMFDCQKIISNIKQSQKYIQDISTMPVPLERSTMPSKKGTRTLDVTKYL